MIRLLADENFNGRVIRGLLLRMPNLDLVRVQDTDLSGADDATVLERAADEDRVLLTHDYRTIPTYAFDRVASGLPMPGVFVADIHLPIRQAIEDILLLAECSDPGEWEGQVRYLPLST